jgi:hypothetical protein
MSAKPHLPWFIRLGDRLIASHERWVTEMRSSAEFHEKLLDYASTRNDASRAWIAEALARSDFARASRIWGGYAIVLGVVGLLAVSATGLRGCGWMLLLSLAIPLLVRFDRWNRRRKAWNRLADGKAWIYEKVEVREPPSGSRIFQSYWNKGEHGQVELDHPIELWHAVRQANEWWQWEMDMPREENGRTRWSSVYEDVGLVHRDGDGRRTLLAAGVVYFSYDPWTDRVDTGNYYE